MISYELLPCPFCGAEAKAVFGGSCNYVTCSQEDGCWFGMTRPTRTPEEAVRIWNRRTIGRSTCQMKSVQASSYSACSRCGAFVRKDAVTDCTEVIPVRFCPNCGEMVAE